MAISLTFDIVICVICLFIIIKNAARGFVKSFVVFAKTILAFLVAYLLTAPVARLFTRLFFGNMSRNWVYKMLISTVDETGSYAVYNLFSGMPQWFTNFIIRSGVDEETMNLYFVEQNSAPIEVVEQIADSLGAQVALIISSIVAFLVVFVLSEIIFAILGALLNKAGKLPILNIVNVLLGAAIGAAISAVIAWLISTAIVYVFRFGANYYPNIFTESIIERTVIVEFFRDHNLWRIIKGFLGI